MVLLSLLCACTPLTVCTEAVAVAPDTEVEVCGGGWALLGWTPDDPDDDAPVLTLLTEDGGLGTDALPPGGRWGNTPSLVAWMPEQTARLGAHGGAPGTLEVSPAGPVLAVAGLTAVPVRGRTRVAVRRSADVGPIEVWARSEVTLHDPAGDGVGTGREIIWWGPGTGVWEVEVAGDWDVVYVRTWDADFGAPPDEVEPNDSRDAATPLPDPLPDAPVDWDGTLDGSEDWFSFLGDDGRIGTLSCLDREVGGLTRPTYQVFDPSGRLVRELNPRSWAVGAADPWNATDFPLTAGLFHVRVVAETAAAGNYYQCELGSEPTEG